MTNLGIRIPPGFTISTYVCDYYNRYNGKFPKGLMDEIFDKYSGSLKYIERELDNGSSFGDNTNPLLLSVRSGAAISMPGMMDTVLNLGLNDESVESLAKLTQNKRFAYDSYRRLIQMYGNVVMGFDISYFEKELEKIKEKNGYNYDTELTVSDLQQLITKYKVYIVDYILSINHSLKTLRTNYEWPSKLYSSSVSAVLFRIRSDCVRREY